MITDSRKSDHTILLDHEIDDLLLQARGLVLVRDLLEARGAGRDEVDAHTEELERVRRLLADTIRGRAAGPTDERLVA